MQHDRSIGVWRSIGVCINISLGTFGNFLVIQVSQSRIIFNHFCSLSRRTSTGKDDSLIFMKNNIMLERQFVETTHVDPPTPFGYLIVTYYYQKQIFLPSLSGRQKFPL
jgi:hypothetical protein